jgi:hypothetical protein
VRLVLGPAVAGACLAWLLAKRYLLRGGWLIWPVLVIVPALLFSVNEARWHRFESGLASAAQPVLAGRDAGFACERLTRSFWSSTGHVGHVWFDPDGTPAHDAFLSSGTCSKVTSWRDHPGRASLEEIVAVHTVAHEAAHLLGQRSEAQAECTALTHDAQVMQRLGASPDQARADLVRYLAQVYPRLPDEYRGECPAVTEAAATALTGRR